MHSGWSFEIGAGIVADKMYRRRFCNYLIVFADLMGNQELFPTLSKNASIWRAFFAELQ
jgi:hypothetical protein